ncbi:uncharacterized protein [Phaseolus vulgaris]|uniref:uncharacterized protein isoform X3 n=1 Tax=Phaseolus vulgaris TaxID=3885 RepID=UPI0035CB7B87
MEGEEELLWKSEPQRESIVSVTLARAITSLLTSRPKKLHDSISRLSSHSSRSHTSLASLEDSLWFFHTYVADAATNNSSLDQLLLPIIDSVLKSKHGDQGMLLLNWLFQDEHLFQPVAQALAGVVARKHVHDRYLLLGWCLLLRNLVEFETSAHQSMFGGIRERYGDLLKILSTCLPDLASIVSKGSTLQDGFELPSRLGVSAADCFLSLSGALTKVADSKKSKLDARAKDQAITFVQSPTTDQKEKLDSKFLMSMIERDYTLWHHLDDIICLVGRLLSWSKKSRFLHAKGLEQVLKWLEEIKDHHGSFQHGAALETDSNALKTGDLLLSSCWKHYSVLLHLEDKKFSQHYKKLLDQYMSGIQYYMDNHTGGGYTDNNDGGLETRKFFLNCLCLLLGRLDIKRFESTVSEFGMNISRILVPQLNCTDEDVIAGVVSIFKAIILRPDYSQEDALTDSRKENSVIPFLLHLLDERDGTARAVVMLIGEYCSMSKDDQCLMEVLKRLDSGNISQRRNAMDVISEVLHISSNSQSLMSCSARKDIANKLLERLGDEEIMIREQASKLLPMIDPSLYLPALVGLVYSSDETKSIASDSIIEVLKHHNQRIEVIFLFLDCLSNTSISLDLPQSNGDKGSKFDTDRLLKLVPVWSKSVQDWNLLIGPLVDKMFADPSNATTVKFLSYISENLANVADLVLHHVLLHVREQKQIDESFLSRWEQRTYSSDEFEEMQQSLFEHLCPLLIIKILPLKTFNDLNSSIMYGHLSKNIIPASRNTDIDCDCISAFLLNRAFSEFEFEDVRKLSAELCGRIHPQVLLPFLCSLLERAVASKNILKIKACLFSICTSLVVRGWESLYHCSMYAIREMIETVLLWPCLNADSVSKAQHGCIDCLALMICAELQAKESITTSMPDKTKAVGKEGKSVVSYVLNQFFNNKNERTSTPEFGDENSEFVAAAVSLSFRLCMGNVLISTCQKISESCKKPFAAQVLPFLLHSLEQFETMSEIRAACTQVLFSAVYHLRSAVLPYASDLLRSALKALRKESDKERIAGAKLIASLMASEDVILENIFVGLLEARSVLSTISSSDPSLELQQLCRNLLACISSP